MGKGGGGEGSPVVGSNFGGDGTDDALATATIPRVQGCRLGGGLRTATRTKGFRDGVAEKPTRRYISTCGIHRV